MRGKLTKALVRSARRAVLLTTLSLVLALAIAVGAFIATSTVAPEQALAAGVSPTPRIADVVTTPTSLSAAPRASAEDTAAVRALSVVPVVPVREQPFEATRVVASPTPTPTPESNAVVRAARAIPRAATAPPLAAGDRVTVSLSFYYCESGVLSAARGDGGGFCGAMRDGSIVYAGAAACDASYLGQRFRIEGDPLGRVYRCADTGSAVHGLHRDIWFATSDEGWTWQRSVGQAATAEIVP